MQEKSSATHPETDLVLEQLPSGDLAWLRPEHDDEPRYWITNAGRAALLNEIRPARK